MAATNLDIILKAIYNGKGIKEAKKDIDDANKAGGRFRDTLVTGIGAIKEIGAAAAIMGGVFKTAFDLAEQGAAIQRTDERLDRLAATIGTTADALQTRMGAATRGLVSDAELAASAGQIISLGLAKSEDSVVRLATVISTLGLDMNQVILTFANNSVMRLDALGLAVDDVRERAARLEAQGLDANAAFDTAVLEALEAKMKLLGGGIDDNAAAFQRLRVEVTNLTDAFKIWLAEGLTPAVAALGGTNAGIFTRMAEGQREAADTLRDYIEAGRGLSEAGSHWLGLGVVMAGVEDEHHRALVSLAQDIAIASGSYGEFERAFNEAFDANARYNIKGLETTRTFYDQAVQVGRLAQALSNAYQPATSMARTETAHLSTATEDAGIAIRDGTGAVVGWVGMMQMLGTGTATAALSARELAGATYEVKEAVADTAPMQKYSDILYGMRAAMAEQREASRQLRAEFNAGITDYIGGAEAADLYTAAFDELGRTTYSYTTIAGGNREELERLQRVYDQTLQDIRDYEAGIKGVTLSEDARARKLDELRAKANNAQAAMAGLGTVTAVTGSTFNAAEFDAQKLSSALLEQSITAGASVFQIQQLMEATGQYSDEQIKAALNAAAMQEKIETLAGMIAEGTITVEDAITALDNFADALSKPFGIYIETGPLKNAITELEKLIGLYQTAAGLARAIDEGAVGSGGSGAGGNPPPPGGTGNGGGDIPPPGGTGNGTRYQSPLNNPGGNAATRNAAAQQVVNIYLDQNSYMQVQGRVTVTAGLFAQQLGVPG